MYIWLQALFFWHFEKKNLRFSRKNSDIFSGNPSFPQFLNKFTIYISSEKTQLKIQNNSGQMPLAKNSAFGIFLNFEIFEKVPQKKPGLGVDKFGLKFEIYPVPGAAGTMITVFQSRVLDQLTCG